MKLKILLFPKQKFAKKKYNYNNLHMLSNPSNAMTSIYKQETKESNAGDTNYKLNTHNSQLNPRPVTCQHIKNQGNL